GWNSEITWLDSLDPTSSKLKMIEKIAQNSIKL
ncbi:tRNA (adenosine(37)-N6)-dimethylallyltransferase MiaA, partial [Xanthomonas citri pv. citri]|nr:tRNA (adenosine(37)-N6)-dimethylallyltransferase MiaA [Xanthomonas citri pv. citri]